MPDRCGNVRRDRLTFELFQAEDGLEEFASSILAAKRKNSHLYFTFSYSHCVVPTGVLNRKFSTCNCRIFWV